MLRKLLLVIYLAIFPVYLQQQHRQMKQRETEKLSFKGQNLTLLAGLMSLCINCGRWRKYLYVFLTAVFLVTEGTLLYTFIASSRQKDNSALDIRCMKNNTWKILNIKLDADDDIYRRDFYSDPKNSLRSRKVDYANIYIKEDRLKTTGNILSHMIEGKLPWYLELNPSAGQQNDVVAYPLDGYFDEVLQNNPTSSLMKYEWARYSSFNKFPIDSPVSPLRLSQSGFYYKGPADRVVCFACNVEHSDWKIGDIPMEVHRKLNPKCDFITGRDNTNIPIHAETGPVGGSNSTTPSQNTSNEATRSLVADGPGSLASETSGQHEAINEACVGATATPISTTKHGDIQVREQCGYEKEVKVQLQKRPPRHPDYADYQKRNDTFKDWPIEHIIPAQILLAAGFVYAGTADCVRCYQCGIGLKNWEQGDDPWAEHARWAQTCDYLLEHKGPEFVKQHATQTDGAHEHDQSVKPTQITKNKTDSIPKQKAPACNETERQDKERKSQQSHSKPAMDQEPSKKGSIEIQAENHRLRSQLICKICMDKETNTVCLPCGHLVTCETCTSRMKRCAICRTKIQARIKVFMS